MKKIIDFSVDQIKYFFVNPFWTSKPILISLALIVLTNILVWLSYQAEFVRVTHRTPVFYATAVSLLNIFLSVILFPKEKLISFSLLGIAILIQILIYFFMRATFSLGGF